MNLGDLLMIDYNFGEPYNYGKPIFIKSHEDVESAVGNRVAENPEEFWVVYYTPMGAHAFLLSRPVPPHVGVSIMKRMKCDEAYMIMSLRRGWYSCRVVRKPRPNDYVAKFWMTAGNGKMHPELEAKLREHDSHLPPEDKYFKD
jgi:hypothetical protein